MIIDSEDERKGKDSKTSPSIHRETAKWEKAVGKGLEQVSCMTLLIYLQGMWKWGDSDLNEEAQPRILK